MERKASYWHILVLALIVALLNEGIHYLLEKVILKGAVPWWGDTLSFIVIVVTVATIYLKVYLKNRNEDE